MEAIEKMIEEINQKARLERETYQQQELDRINRAKETAQLELEKKSEKSLTSQRAMLEDGHSKQLTQQKLEKQKAILSAKQQLIGQLFDEAAKEMSCESAEEQQRFAEGILSALPLEGHITLIPGELSKEIFTAQWIEKFSNNQEFQLKLATTSVPKAAGFILSTQTVRYHFLYQQLVDEVRKEMESELSNALAE